MANRNFHEQPQEIVPDVIMAKFIDQVGPYFTDLDMTIGQEKNSDPRASGTVLTFTNPRTAAMFAAYQIGRRSTEYVPGAFVLARLEGSTLLFDDRKVYLDHQEAARAQRNKSRTTQRRHLLFSTTQKTMEYAATVSRCDIADFEVAAGVSPALEYKDEKFSQSQLKFLERHFGVMVDNKIKDCSDELMDRLLGALELIKQRIDDGSMMDQEADDSEENNSHETGPEDQTTLQFESAGLTD